MLLDRKETATNGTICSWSAPDIISNRSYRAIPASRFDGKTVVFVDKRKEEFGTVIWAIGYSTVFPFFDRSVASGHLPAIAGRLTRPANIAARIEREMTHTNWRFVDHPRHQGEVDYHDLRRSRIAELRTAVPHRMTVPVNR
jgi:hypothetical protein